MTLLTYWAISALITHAAQAGRDKSRYNPPDDFKAKLAGIIAALILGPFFAPFILYKVIAYVFEYIDMESYEGETK